MIVKGSMMMKEIQVWAQPQKHRRRRRTIPFIRLVLAVGVLAVIYCAFRQVQSPMEPQAEGGMVLRQSEEIRHDTTQADTPWYLTLVNRWNPIPTDYEVNLIAVPGGEKVDERIYDPLMEMLDAAAEEELEPTVVSGYRTQEKQARLYDDKIAEYQSLGYSDEEAVELAQEWVAIPGRSEHQLGLAVDINGGTYEIYTWLQENSYKYGFIFRYPGGKSHLTGTAEEVWHYRYVGVEAATEMYEQDICLEEYLADSINAAA